MKLGQTSALYFAAKFFGSVLGFFATVYFARVLGETVLGYYGLVLTVVTWAGLFGSVGLSKAITKRVSEGDDSDRFFVTGSTIILILGIMLALLILLLSDFVNQYVGQEVSGFVVVLLFAALLFSVVKAGLHGKHLVHIYAILSAVKETVRAITQIALVALGLGLTGMLLGYAVGGFLVAVVGLLYVKPSLVRPTTTHARELIDFAKFSWLGGIRSKSFEWIDIAVLGFFVQTGLVGIYLVAWSIAKFLDIFGSAISSTLFPEMSQVATEKGPEAVGNLTQNAVSFAGLFLVPGLVGGWFIGDRLLLIYGENFPQGSRILIILVAALLIYTYVKQLLNTLNAIDRPDLAFRANGAFIVANVVLNVLLVYQYGWIGAAVATALSAAVGLTIAFYYARQLVDFAVPYGEITRQWIAALLMGAVVYLAREAGEGTAVAAVNEAFVLLLVALGAGVYFLTLLAISTAFRTTVSRNLPIDVPLL